MVRTLDGSLLLCAWLAGIIGCNDSSSQASASGDPVESTTNVDASTTAAGGASSAPICPDTTDAIQAELFAPKCGLSACHTGDYPASGLDLTSPGLEERVAMVLGVDCVDRLASPGEHQYSMLWKKVRYDDPGCGERMPQGGPALEDWEIDCIAAWIDAMPMPTEPPPPASTTPPVEPGDAGPAPDLCDAGQVLCGRTCIDEVEPTLTALFDRVWYPSCGRSNSCHTGSNPKEYLWLDTRQGVLDMLNLPSIQRPEVDLVAPGSSADSYVVMKIRGEGMSETSSTGLTSMQMPRLAPPLCEPLIQAVETWISEGAQDN